MSVENNVHNRAPITVADGSGAKPGAAPGKPAPARPTPGNANAPVKPLPDVKPDPERATSSEIVSGLLSLRQNRIGEGRDQLSDGIDRVVKKFVGNSKNYTEVKLATDNILSAYANLNGEDKKALSEAVDEYLGRWVIEGLRNAKNDDELNLAIKAAVTRVTDAGPNRTARAHRYGELILDIATVNVAYKAIADSVVADVKARCEERITPAEIDAGLQDLRKGNIVDGESQIFEAIVDIVKQKLGQKKDYDTVKPVTDKILEANRGRPQKDFQVIVNIVAAICETTL